MTDEELELEEAIASAKAELLAATTRFERIRKWRKMRFLILQRSPERNAEIEREKGIPMPRPATP